MTIFAPEKPKYPVVDPNPPFRKVVGNFNTSNYLGLSSFTASAVGVAYGIISGTKKVFKGHLAVLGMGGLVGLMTGFPYAFSGSFHRLRGFSRNEGEVARYTNVISENAALAKPKYLALDPNPPFTKVVGNFATHEYLKIATFIGTHVPVGYVLVYLADIGKSTAERIGHRILFE